jgi:ParB-like chromosome segregation protein Spo0J
MGWEVKERVTVGRKPRNVAGTGELVIEDIAVGDIHPAPYNPRKPLRPGDPAYDRLKKAVDRFGMVEPLVWNKRSGNLVGGHQRFDIMVGRGDTVVRCSVVDLSDLEEKALNLALNKHAGEWDVRSLADLVAELKIGTFDLDVTGFDPTELVQLEAGTPLHRGDVERVAMATLQVDPDNVRRHDSRSVQTIKESLGRFGQQRPVVVTRADRIVRAGNGTYLAAEALGWKHITVQWSDLAPQDAIAFAMVDNRSTDVSKFDTQELSQALQALKAAGYNINGLGWADYELEPLLAADWAAPEVTDPLESFTRDALSGDDYGEPIRFTRAQRETVDKAIAQVRQEHGSITEGRAVEIICKFLLESAPQ